MKGASTFPLEHYASSIFHHKNKCSIGVLRLDQESEPLGHEGLSRTEWQHGDAAHAFICAWMKDCRSFARRANYPAPRAITAAGPEQQLVYMFQWGSDCVHGEEAIKALEVVKVGGRISFRVVTFGVAEIQNANGKWALMTQRRRTKTKKNQRGD